MRVGRDLALSAICRLRILSQFDPRGWLVLIGNGGVDWCGGGSLLSPTGMPCWVSVVDLIIVELVIPLGLGHRPMQDYLVEGKLQEEVPEPLPSLVLSLWAHGLGNVLARAARM